MVGELIMLPVRIGVRATQLWLRVAEETASVAVDATSRLVGLASSRGADGSAPSDVRKPRERDAPEAPPDDERGDPATQGGPSSGEAEPGWPAERSWPADQPSPTGASSPSGTRRGSTGSAIEDEPARVSEEPELVEEFAEPGAEDGAGAQIRVEAPWDGYDHMNAKQVIARLASATPAELTAVHLYESTKRRRQTILNAVQRELRSSNGSNSQRQERGST